MRLEGSAGLAGASVLRGTEGFGASSRIHTPVEVIRYVGRPER